MENEKSVKLFGHGKSTAYSRNEKQDPGVYPELHCGYQELKPKGETNSSFLILHQNSGVHTVKTVGSHLNLESPFTVTESSPE